MASGVPGIANVQSEMLLLFRESWAEWERRHRARLQLGQAGATKLEDLEGFDVVILCEAVSAFLAVTFLCETSGMRTR